MAALRPPSPHLQEILPDLTLHSTLHCLPKETWAFVLSLCSLRDIFNFALTCKKAHLITEDQLLWKQFCSSHLGCKGLSATMSPHDHHQSSLCIPSWKSHVIIVFQCLKQFGLLKPRCSPGSLIPSELLLASEDTQSTSIITRFLYSHKKPSTLIVEAARVAGCSSSRTCLQQEILTHLLVHGCSPNKPCLSGTTPMLSLAGRNRLHKILRLAHIHFNGDIERPSSNGITPLHQAALSDATENVRYLLQQKVDPNPLDKNLDSPLIWAATRGNLQIVKTLITKVPPIHTIKNIVGETPLMAAAKSSNSELVAFLLDVYKVDPNEKNCSGDTALHLAAEFGNWKTLKLLLAFGADPNIRSNLNDQPVHYASKNTSPKFIRKLAKHGSQLHSQGNSGFTLLHYAAAHEHQYNTLLWLLDNALSDALLIDAADALGNTPLMIAAARGLLANVQLLVERGAGIRITNHQGVNAVMAAQVLQHKSGQQVSRWLHYYLDASRI